MLPLAPHPAPLLQQASDDALDLLSRMMAFDASRRISAADALQHRYFRTDPLPSSVEQLPKPQKRAAGPGGGGAATGGAATDGTGAATGGAAAGSAGQQGQAGAASHGEQRRPAGGGSSGADAPAAAGQQEAAAQQAGPAATPPFGGRPLSAVPESLVGRVERPKLDSGDLQYFKKRKFNLDDALEGGGEGA